MSKELLPREKALAYGMKVLSDAELVAILFGTGIQGKDVFALCREILQEHEGHLSRVARMSAHEFMERYKGHWACQGSCLPVSSLACVRCRRAYVGRPKDNRLKGGVRVYAPQYVVQPRP